MTLRGSVASFPLETIIQLLAATAKTGQLEVRSGGESGTLGFAEGRLVSAVSGDDGGDPALGAVFTLSDGDFEFVPWGDPPDANLAGDLNQLLDRAVVQRDKIVADRTLIADDRVRFSLSDSAAAQGEVRLSAEQWRALLTVNGERDLRAIAQQLRFGRLATLAMLADLVRAGIIRVTEAPSEPPPPAPGSGPSGGSSGSGSSSFTSTPPSREWDKPRAEATELQPTAAAPPDAPVWEEPAAPREPPVREEPAALREPPVWEEPAARPETPDREEPAATRDTPGWDELAAPLETPVWNEPVGPREMPVWDAPAPSPSQPDPPSRDAPFADVRTWDAPVGQTRTWQTPARPTETERDWGLPPQDWETAGRSSRPSWPEPDQIEPARPDPALKDSLTDPIAASEGEENDAPSAPEATDTEIDERLSALSAFGGGSAWPPADEPRATAFSAPTPVAEPEPQAPPAEEPKKKGGLFSGLFKKDATQARVEHPAVGGPSVETGSRVTKLAGFANALLDEFNNGQYGKGRLDDRIANLLMRVDEQADPIDRPLPIVDDRIDVSTLERASMSERQVAPYLALLITQIYEDAEHSFGKEKAKRGFKTVQAAVVGDPAALGTDLRLPRV